MPYRIHNQIFQLLDTPTALTCRLVCKKWEAVIALSHEHITLPHKCKPNALRMLIVLFPRVRHIVLPSKFRLNKFEWETVFPPNRPSVPLTPPPSPLIHKPTIDLSNISGIMNCLKLSKALRKATQEHGLIISLLTRALTLVQTKPKKPVAEPVMPNEVVSLFLCDVEPFLTSFYSPSRIFIFSARCRR